LAALKTRMVELERAAATTKALEERADPGGGKGPERHPAYSR
jgi:hypothetical protein